MSKTYGSFGSILITGANRGIGLELTRNLLSFSASPLVIATCRNPDAATELKNIQQEFQERCFLLKVDIENDDSISTAVESCKQILKDVGQEEQGISLLINNAGQIDRAALSEVTRENMTRMFNVNAVSPLMFTRAFLPLMRTASGKGNHLEVSKPTVAFVSSKIASLADNMSGGRYPYRASKVALNMVAKNLAVELLPQGIRVGIFHPGWVRTDMGGPNGLIDTETSARGLVEQISTLSDERVGIMLNYDGQVIPW